MASCLRPKHCSPPLTAGACARGLGWSHCRRRLGRGGGVGSCGWFGSGSCDWLGSDRCVGSCGQQAVPHACGREAADWRADRSMPGMSGVAAALARALCMGGEPAIPNQGRCPTALACDYKKRYCWPHHQGSPIEGLTCAWHALVMQHKLPTHSRARPGCGSTAPEGGAGLYGMDMAGWMMMLGSMPRQCAAASSADNQLSGASISNPALNPSCKVRRTTVGL